MTTRAQQSSRGSCRFGRTKLQIPHARAAAGSSPNFTARSRPNAGVGRPGIGPTTSRATPLFLPRGVASAPRLGFAFRASRAITRTGVGNTKGAGKRKGAGLAARAPATRKFRTAYFSRRVPRPIFFARSERARA